MIPPVAPPQSRDDEEITESPELIPQGVAGTLRYRATSVLTGASTCLPVFSIVGEAGRALAFSHLNAAFTFVHFETFGLKSTMALCRRSG